MHRKGPYKTGAENESRLRLRQLREKEGLTQAELAKKIGTNSENVSRWEAGKREPGIEMLICLSRYFEVPIGYLIIGGHEGSEEDRAMLEYMRHSREGRAVLYATYQGLQKAQAARDTVEPETAPEKSTLKPPES